MLLPLSIAAAATAGAGAAWYGLPHVLKQGDRRHLRALSKGSLSLTFDDGPTPGVTDGLLEVLEARGARATFFVIGDRAERYPEVIKRILDAGHEVGSHSQTHVHAWKSQPFAAQADVARGIRSVERVVAELTGEPQRQLVFRPPYGKATLGSRLAAGSRPRAFWTADSGDTWGELPDAGHAAAVIARDGGGVALLHDQERSPTDDGARRVAFVLKAVHDLLDLADRDGLTVRPFGELLGGTAGP